MIVDQDLIKRCIKKDRRAQYNLYKHCYGILMPVCYRYKYSEEMSREILNQGFLKIVMNLKKYQSSVPFDAWCKRIMINTIIDEYRKEKKTKEVMQSTDYSEITVQKASVSENLAIENFEDENLTRIMLQVPEMSRKVFNLYAIEGYKHQEIAELLNISIGTSKWHVSNARKILQKLIKSSVKALVSLLL